MATRAIRTIGGVGAQGAQGSGTSIAPAAPELTALAVSAGYAAYGNDYLVTVTFAATLPVSDTNYPHLKRVEIEQTAGVSLQAPIAAQNAPFSPDGANKIYLTAAPFLLSLLPASTGFTFRGVAINDDGDASGSPATCSITIAPTTVTGVVGSEVVNSVYQDENGGLHLEVAVALSVTSPQFPAPVTIWADFDDGRGWVHQGVKAVASGSETITLGSRRASSSGVSQAGDIWVPTDPDAVNWKIAAIAGRWDTPDPPSGFEQDSFTVTAVPAATSSEITNAYLVPDATTGGELIYGVDHVGRYHWQYSQINWLQPTIYASPFYWFSALTVQLGYAATGTATVSGGVNIAKSGDLATPAGGEPDFTAADVGMEIHIGTVRRTITAFADADHVVIDSAVSNGAGQSIELWRQAPVNAVNGQQGIDENIAEYKGRRVVNADPVQGSASVLKTWVQVKGPHPPEWDLPPAKLLDGTDNPYRTFRFRIASWTRRAANPSGGSSVSELQVCWSGGTADHYNVTPAIQAPALDLSQANPETSARAIEELYLADQAASARVLAASSVTYANAAVAANALVDSNIAALNLGKLLAGTVVFSGNIALARGNGSAVVTMDNTGIFLFSACTASGSAVTPGVAGSPSYTAAGVTSSPYVGVTASQIGVFSSLTGPSVTITGTGVNIWSVNGSTSNPRAILTSTAFTITNGNQSATVGASSVVLAISGGASATLSSSGLVLQDGSYSVTLTSSSLLLAVAGGATATFSSSTLTFASSSNSVTISSSSVAIASGSYSLTATASSVVLNANSTLMTITANEIKMTVPSQITAAFDVFGSTSLFSIQAFTNAGSSFGVSGDSSKCSLVLAGPSGGVEIKTQFTETLLFNGTQVLTRRQTGPGNTTDVTDVAGRFNNLLTALRTHGLIT